MAVRGWGVRGRRGTYSICKCKVSAGVAAKGEGGREKAPRGRDFGIAMHSNPLRRGRRENPYLFFVALNSDPVPFLIIDNLFFWILKIKSTLTVYETGE